VATPVVDVSGCSFAASLKEAELRFCKWKQTDPFPSIPPALLNSSDIIDYVNMTSLIYDFDAGALKSSAYEMHLGNEFMFWKDNIRQHIKKMPDGAPFILPQNSITYVTTKEVFFIPDYLALRFNLLIEFVHRGMLLGTGPLVNPGFSGRLMIPIHNLTTNQYEIRVGAPIISVEVTKISPLPGTPHDRGALLQYDAAPRCGKYVPNNSKFKGEDASFEKFSQRALGDLPLHSFLKAIQDDYKGKVAELSERYTKYMVLSGIAIVATGLGVLAFVVACLSFVNDTSSYLQQRIDVLSQLFVDRNGVEPARDKSLSKQILELEKKIRPANGSDAVRKRNNGE